MRNLLVAMTIGAWVAATPSLAEQVVKAAVLTVERERPQAVSRLDLPPDDDGAAGGRQATKDNNTTGKFLDHVYETLEVSTVPAEATATLDRLIGEGVQFVVTIAVADDLLALADHAAGRDVLFLNVSAPDDRLRNADCRANVLHIAPSRAMLADGLAQYMVWKKWTDWLLIHGSHPEDRAKAEAYRRAAKRFGLDIVEEREFEDTGGARRSDSGHAVVQKQIPLFTQRAEDHDVVVVADESQVFGVYIPYRTWDPRPVVGDAGLIARAWHPAFEGWGASQLQRRFEKTQGRQMTDLDYLVWTALRAVGEAVTRASGPEFAAIRDHIRSEKFELAAFKGEKLSFRPWNNQLRQGVLLADGKLVVTVSPQDEFLHNVTRLDTLGYDRRDSSCAF